MAVSGFGADAVGIGRGFQNADHRIVDLMRHYTGSGDLMTPLVGCLSIAMFKALRTFGLSKGGMVELYAR